jgi:hypothetical protein
MDIEWINRKGKRKLYSNATPKLLQILANRKGTIRVKPISEVPHFDIGNTFVLKKRNGGDS